MKDFNNFNFSVFECDFNSFTKAMYEQYKQSFVENRVKIYSSPLDVTKYIDVPHGGSHYPKMSWWANKLYRNLIFFISNRRDGMSSLCHNISRELGCKLYKFGISKGEEAYYGCTFFYCNKGIDERSILAYMEDRWVFWQEGELLPFENPEYYSNRFIKKRLNYDILVEYLGKMGINLFDIDSNVTNCMTFERLKWDSEE
ncbi:MAG: hypothetical protein IJX44_03355 [Bacteroidaceae bacterium]|nr:hypothetical protein [Bacteroidaceae bacterium]